MPSSLPDRFGPAPANTLGRRAEDHAKKLGTTPVTLAGLLLSAAERSGMSRQELAGVLGYSEAEFSKAFSTSEVWADRNRAMKAPLPAPLAEALVAVSAERTGLQHRAALSVAQAVVQMLAVTA